MTLSLNLVLQIGISILLVLGLVLVKKLRFINHGYIMFFAVAFNLFSLIFLMFPSALKILSGASLNYFTILVALHSILGAVAELWGVYIVVTWRFRSVGSSCFRLAIQMRRLFLLWAVVAALGFVLYGLLYSL